MQATRVIFGQLRRIKDITGAKEEERISGNELRQHALLPGRAGADTLKRPGREETGPKTTPVFEN